MIIRKEKNMNKGKRSMVIRKKLRHSGVKQIECYDRANIHIDVKYLIWNENN